MAVPMHPTLPPWETRGGHGVPPRQVDRFSVVVKTEELEKALPECGWE